MTIFRPACLVLSIATVAVAAHAAAAPIRLQPDEAASKDVFVYEFDVPGFFGIPTAARDTNLDSVTLNAITPPPVPFGNFLGAAETDPFSLTPGGPLRMHTTRTLIGFDVAGLGVGAGQVGRATLNLFALPALPAFESPDAGHPVITDVHAVTESWSETAVTWNSRPGVGDAILASVTQDGVNRWVSFDVTDLVRGWIADPLSNNGLQLSQRDVVELAVPGQRDRYFASLFASSAFADAALRPYLEIETAPAPVPLPAPVALLAAAFALLASFRRPRSA